MIDAPRLLLLFSSLLLLLIVVAACLYDTAWDSSQRHPRVATMEVGGPRSSEDAQHWWLGLGFGVVTILTLVTSLLFAAREGEQARSLRRAVIAGGFVYIAVFVGMMMSYRRYMTEEPTTLGPFAAPTTWMVLGLWTVPLLFVAIYCIHFRDWFEADPPTLAEGDRD
ncbi:MAG: hypothetical protein AAGD07_11940 [Planctomycetota bacterium]